MRTLAPLLWLTACALPSDDLDGDGWTTAAGDCDDLDVQVHPEALDLEADGIDQDCDGSDPLMVVLGQDHRCLLQQDGHVSCVGDNSLGQLEAPDDETAWVKLTAGAYHTCALSLEGEVSCWGDDRWGQASPPVPRTYDDIEAGDEYTVGVLVSGIALCWGRCVGQQPRP
jgi:hypothetical protein